MTFCYLSSSGWRWQNAILVRNPAILAMERLGGSKVIFLVAPLFELLDLTGHHSVFAEANDAYAISEYAFYVVPRLNGTHSQASQAFH